MKHETLVFEKIDIIHIRKRLKGIGLSVTKPLVIIYPHNHYYFDNESMVNYRRIQAKVGMTSFYKAIAVLVVLIAVTQNPQYDGHGSRQFSVAAFLPRTPSRISRTKIVGSGTSEPSPVETSNTVLRMALGNKNKNDESEEVSPVFWEDIGKKPGNLIFLPIVAIVGIDLLLNIIFITKRSIEYFLLGQAPSTETWF